MSKQVSLSDVELKALDLMIAYKHVNPLFITDVANAVGQVADAVVKVAGAAAVVTAVVAGAEELSKKLQASAGPGVSLEELVKLRQSAVERK